MSDVTPAALAAGDPDAWTTLQRAYAPLCRRWAYRAGLDPADLWQEAAARLWRALTTGRTFPSGAALGAYLGACVRCAAIDAARVRRAPADSIEAESSPEGEVFGAIGEALAVRDPDPADSEVLRWCLARCADDRERATVLAWAWDMPTRDQAARWPTLFADAADAQRVRRALTQRLQRVRAGAKSSPGRGGGWNRKRKETHCAAAD